jgi:hypothetical protein
MRCRAGRQDDHSRGDRGDRPEEVTDDVQVGAANVEIVVGVSVQQERAHHVDSEAERRHREHDAAVDDHGLSQTLPSFHEDEAEMTSSAAPFTSAARISRRT